MNKNIYEHEDRHVYPVYPIYPQFQYNICCCDKSGLFTTGNIHLHRLLSTRLRISKNHSMFKDQRERERESIVACILGTYCAPKLMRGSHLLLVLFQTVTSQLQDAKSMVKFRMVNIDCNTSQ